VVFGPLSHTPVPRFACTAWFLLLTIGACLLLASIDALVMLRVYILYNRSTVVAAFLTALMFLQFGLVAMCTGRTLHVVPFSNTCDVLQTPHDVVYIMGGVILTQAVLLILTLAKRKVAFGASPLVHMVVHDGARVFVLIVSLWMTIIPYSLFMQVSKPHIIFVWPIALMSIATCRLVMHMQKLPLEVLSSSGSELADMTGTVVLTTYLASLENFHTVTAPTNASLPSTRE